VSAELILRDLPEPDAAAAAAVARRAARVLRPTGALARLDEVASWLAGWQRTDRPSVQRPAALVFAADHGVAARRGVSAYPADVTAAMLDALRSGAATASVMARQVGVQLDVVDVGVGRPSGDITIEDALDHSRFAESFDRGRAAVAALESDLLVLGEMGIGNTTPAAAVCASLFGMRTEDWTGRGTGVDDEGLARKLAAVAAARARVEGAPPLEILRRAGGAEMAALAGAVLEARLRSIPVVLDGFVVTASVATLEVECPGALAHCVAGHCSQEAGHRLLLEKLALRPLLDLELRLGEGSGALAAVPLVKLAAACVTEVATFEEWGLG
jgi:nicotinate-nucleotide--dimethylbenzimidazole phosphoribosyltransferase